MVCHGIVLRLHSAKRSVTLTGWPRPLTNMAQVIETGWPLPSASSVNSQPSNKGWLFTMFAQPSMPTMGTTPFCGSAKAWISRVNGLSLYWFATMQKAASSSLVACFPSRVGLITVPRRTSISLLGSIWNRSPRAMSGLVRWLVARAVVGCSFIVFLLLRFA